MARLKTHSEFIEEVNILVGKEYSMLDKYKGAHEKIEMKHNKCGFVYFVTPNKFLLGRRCPKCQRRYRRNTREFKAEVFESVGDHYSVQGEFLGVENKVRMKHNDCGHTFNVTPKHFLFSRSRCPKCFGKERWSNDQFVRMVVEIVGSEYTFLAEYKGYDVHIPVRHNNCGNEYFVTPNKFLGLGTRCAKCKRREISNRQKKSDEEVQKQVHERFGKEFIVVSQYEGAFSPLRVLHSNCNNEFEVSGAKNFINGNGFCPYCDKGTRFSRGAKRIAEFLNSRDINFVTEYVFDDCVFKRVLFFDFAIFHLGELICLIEFDGQQHFFPIDVYGGEEAYLENQIKDNIKNEYCNSKGIALVRISYDQLEELEEMLIKYFEDLGFMMAL